MTSRPANPAPTLSPAAEHYATRIRSHLDRASHDLPHDVGARLSAARARAIAQRKRAPTTVRVVHTAPAVLTSGSAAVRGGPRFGFDWWRGLGAALPVLALVLGLGVISSHQHSRYLVEVASLDEALLTDAVPPQAYADPGFVAFLKSPASDHALHLLSDDARMPNLPSSTDWYHPAEGGAYPDSLTQ